MRIENVSRLPTRLVRRAIEFARPPRRRGESFIMPNVHVRDRVGDPFAGEFVAMFNRVTVEVGPPSRFPFWRPAWRGYARHRFGSPAEALVYVLAHEFRHVWQMCNLYAVRVGGGGMYSERDAEHYALAVLERWRG